MWIVTLVCYENIREIGFVHEIIFVHSIINYNFYVQAYTPIMDFSLYECTMNNLRKCHHIKAFHTGL
jgi:hypothetical protein